nr:immunoglobulin light chain junction region [Macaca mulatta]
EYYRAIGHSSGDYVF